MLFLFLILLLGTAVCVLLRSLVLSRHAQRFLAHDLWRYDTGMRYAWIGIGVAFLSVAAFRGESLAEWLTLAAMWLGGLVVVWCVPPRLAKFF